MDLRAYLSLFRRWLWLIVLLAVIAAGLSFIISRIAPLQYQAAVTIQVGSAQYLQNPNTGLIQTSEQLADTYAVIVKKYPVLEATANKLQLNIAPTDLLRYFQVRVVPNTALLEITVTYPDPVIAADMANELGNELIANSPTDLALSQQAQIKTLEGEIASAQSELDNARKELRDTNDKIANTPGTPPADLVAHSNDLVTQINAAQANFAQLSTTLANLQKEGSANSLKFVEAAQIPDKPSGLALIPTSVLAGLAGAVVALGVAFVFEYLNDTIRNPAELSGPMGIRFLGSIAPFGKRNSYNDKLITWLQPRSPISEAYRALRVNLMYSERNEAEPSLRTYVVSSPSPTEGKTVTAGNLAVTFAMAGLQVLLIDADMRRPNQHNMFGLPNTSGLSDALSKAGQVIPTDNLLPSQNGQHNSDSLEEVRGQRNRGRQPVKPKSWFVPLLASALIQKTEIPGLKVMTAGLSPSNPAELLGTAEMKALVAHLYESKEFDVLIFDTPPILTVSDAHILASVAAAKVLIVVEASKTRRRAIARSVQQLASLSIPLVGVVINRLNPREIDSGYSYYYGYYSQSMAANLPADLPSAEPAVADDQLNDD